MIAAIAEHVATASGDCRQALQQLLQVGRNAEHDDDSKVKMEHIQFNLSSRIMKLGCPTPHES